MKWPANLLNETEMKLVERSDIVDHVTYEETREVFRKEVLEGKARRRIHVGEYFTFLFENTLTIRYQIQEMMRIEQIVREKDILHEIDTYNGILGEEGELGCTLMIAIDEEQDEELKLLSQIQLPEHIYVVLAEGTRIYPKFNAAQRGEIRLASVQYLKFPVKNRIPIAIGIDLPIYQAETALTEDQKSALAEDLGVGPTQVFL